MRTPGFWTKRKPTLLARALQPIGLAYGASDRAAHAADGRTGAGADDFVGNFVAGGDGETPIAIALARMLIASGRRVAFLSHGYGGAERVEPLLVDADAHHAAMVGDEPLLLAGSRRAGWGRIA